MFVIAVKFQKVARYNHESFKIKHAEPKQVSNFVRYNHLFVITVIVITEFDCTILSIRLKYAVQEFYSSNRLFIHYLFVLRLYRCLDKVFKMPILVNFRSYFFNMTYTRVYTVM